MTSAASASGASGRSGAVRIGNCSGFYGDRLSAMREMLTGGDAGLPHRRLPGRTDHAHPGPRPAEEPGPRLRQDLPDPTRGLPGPGPGPWRPIVANAGGLNPAGLADAVRALAERLGLDARVAHVEGDDLLRARGGTGPGHAAGRERLPRRVGHRRLPQRRRRRRRHRPGHRRLGDRRAGGSALRLGPHRLRRARRRRRRRARHRMRHPGHRRQLLVLHRSSRSDPPRLPARRDPRRRLVGDHQAPGHRRAGQRRHRHRATALRDHRRPLRQPRRHRADGHRRAVRRTAPIGCASAACAANRRRPRSRCRSTPSAASATR